MKPNGTSPVHLTVPVDGNDGPKRMAKPMPIHLTVPVPVNGNGNEMRRRMEKPRPSIAGLQYHEFRRMSIKPPVIENAIQVTNLCKAYKKDGPLVLNNFNMNVEKGTIYGLLGASGCGKTSALSCIVGLKGWDSGEVLVFGEVPGTKASGIPGKRLGYVPQDIALYDHLSIKENIQYYGRLYGMAERDILEQWRLLVNLLQLPKDFKLVTNLSGGQRRRASLSLALVHQPCLLILDEPTVGLDPLLRESVWEHLYNMVQTRGTTIIITTHYIEESRHSDKIGVMRRGRLLIEDNPTILMEQHKTDLLEDVVLKLCWADTKNGFVKDAQRAHLFTQNNNDSNDKSRDSDNDSGTGTDNDNIVEIDASGANDDACETDSQGDKTIAIVVPSSGEESSDKRKQLKRSPSSEFAGVLFQSKWKPDLECVVVADDNKSVQGKYKKNVGFDSSPVAPRKFQAPRYHGGSSCWESLKRPKKLLSNLVERAQRVAAFCCVIYLSLIRHPVFFLASLVLPAVEVLLTISSVGKEPIGLRIAVINEEMPDWVTQCHIDYLDNFLVNSSTALNNTIRSIDEQCNFDELSCRYLNLINKGQILNLVPYNNTAEAVEGVHRGDIWGYFHFASNYSQHMLDRLATKQFAFEETIDGSTISLKMDMSQYLGSILIIQHLFDGLQNYIQQLIGACDLGARQVEIPLHYRKPVYGELDGNYHRYLIPGVLANIMFMMPFAISGIVFITDQKLGTSERAKVAGLKTVEIMLSYAITQGTIVASQVIICTLCLQWGFNFEIEGSFLLYLAITLLLGMCGQAFGLLVGIFSTDELEALITALFILPTMLMFGGVIWPIHCMAPLWRYIGYVIPTTLITESLRSTAIRGVGITHALVWPGIAVTFGYLVFFWIASLISYKILIK